MPVCRGRCCQHCHSCTTVYTHARTHTHTHSQVEEQLRKLPPPPAADAAAELYRRLQVCWRVCACVCKRV
jgi:hypothetical protein